MKFERHEVDVRLIPFQQGGMQPTITRGAGMEATHLPTGIKVIIPPEVAPRSQHRTYQLVLEALEYVVGSL